MRASPSAYLGYCPIAVQKTRTLAVVAVTTVNLETLQVVTATLVLMVFAVAVME
jgi:hypothetical protein